jgi:hypothetical protein
MHHHRNDDEQNIGKKIVVAALNFFLFLFLRIVTDELTSVARKCSFLFFLLFIFKCRRMEKNPEADFE